MSCSSNAIATVWLRCSSFSSSHLRIAPWHCQLGRLQWGKSMIDHGMLRYASDKFKEVDAGEMAIQIVLADVDYCQFPGFYKRLQKCGSFWLLSSNYRGTRDCAEKANQWLDSAWFGRKVKASYVTDPLHTSEPSWALGVESSMPSDIRRHFWMLMIYGDISIYQWCPW